MLTVTTWARDGETVARACEGFSDADHAKRFAKSFSKIIRKDGYRFAGMVTRERPFYHEDNAREDRGPAMGLCCKL